jgi:hypothetical protein
MKNTFKFLLATILFVGLWSCEDEQDLMFLTPPASFNILTPEAGTSVVLTPELQNNPALTISWSSADYGSPASITYDVEIAKAGTDFETFLVAGNTTNTNITWLVSELNSAAVAAGLTPFTEDGLDIRIKASTGTSDSQPVYSNAITVLVTTYTTELPKLAVPGNHQGWNPPTAPRLAASGFGETDYEGYVWLDGGYKFLAPDGSGNFNWGNTDYGDNGDFSGILAEQNESDCTATAGYYRVQANTTALTYNSTAVSWGIIGAATPTGWDSDTDFVYNSTTQKLEIASIALVPGAFKFRGNNAWSNGFDFGTVNADGFLVEGGDLTFDGPAGNYKVVLDLSNPREYTFELIAL